MPGNDYQRGTSYNGSFNELVTQLSHFIAGQHDVVPHPFNAFYSAPGHRKSESVAGRRCDVEGHREHAHRPGSDPCCRRFDVKVHAVAKGD